ncbi:MAG: DUF4011 domain-containing protein [Deltaproteobacteria bacterium]|jgi:superfamily I DNA and/or RNA helicase/very-short-patch-repair endonuclease|nr:DUF4011 domain-containing protein [Deltaproteobacteria bacterium]
MAKIEEKIEFWKKQLLDLGKRNRLIHSPLPKSSGSPSRRVISIVKPNASRLWKIFAEDNGEICFSKARITRDETIRTDPYILVETNQSELETNKTLRNIQDKVRTFQEEQGLNILHLAFGFLHWREEEKEDEKKDDKENEKESKVIRSPLLLIPVQLTKKDLFSQYVLSRNDDEITHNNALLEKLKNNFGIKLPEYSEDTDIGSYMLNVEEQYSSSQSNWQVTDDVELSMYLFSNMSMYHDLDKHAEIIKNHKIIRTLVGEKLEIDEKLDEISEFNHDEVDPREVFSVIDADSSQQDAILLAKRGGSFVLQGPPGTGKSQTITNIIAELIAQNKRVLFVSAKLAALEVVNKRLRAAGLIDFCLTLHSHNAKRKEVLEQLNNSLVLSENSAALTGSAYTKLFQLKVLRERLNDYSRKLHTTVEPLGETIYTIFGKILSLKQYPKIYSPIKNAESIGKFDLELIKGVLNEFSKIIKQSGYQDDNPWADCKVKFSSNQFKHEFKINSQKALELCQEGINITKSFSMLIGDKNELLFSKIPDISTILHVASEENVIQKDWLEIADKALKILISCVAQIQIRENKNHEIDDCKEERKSRVVERDKAKLSHDEFKGIYTTTYEKLKSEKETILEVYTADVFNIKAIEVFERYRTKYRSILRIFYPQYHKDRKEILSYKKTAKKISFKASFEILDKLTTLKIIEDEFENQSETYLNYKKNLENHEKIIENIDNHILQKKNDLSAIEFQIEQDCKRLSELLKIKIDDKHDFEKLHSRLVWAMIFARNLKLMPIPEEYIGFVCINDSGIKERSKKLAIQLDDFYNRSLKVFENFANLFSEPKIILENSIKYLESRIKKCNDNFIYLDYYIHFNEIVQKSKQLSIDNFVLCAKDNNLSAEHIVPVFEECFYISWIDKVLEKDEYQIIKNFWRLNQEEDLTNFKSLDILHMDIAKDALFSKLVSRLPNLNTFTSGHGELGLLKRELAKQSRFKPTRKLFASLPTLLPVLKPCLMMSPLSVSIFLSDADYKFDTVIFDEASQVRTEEAICAIYRGQQVIIAGDTKQLPPTDFFNVTRSDKDDEESDEEVDSYDSSAFPSILDEATLFPSQTLKWHYRSKHEHLIAFSNVKFYGGKLITFPSSTIKKDGLGVEYIYVKNGFNKKGYGNTEEATRVAELTFEHLKKFPKRSLGIIAFGKIQQKAIQDALDKMRENDLSFETFFQNNSDDENIFIKNLETVQGDERDTIIFSIGYSRTYSDEKQDKMKMFFGPLSYTGGERRLNVAITRARYNIKLVGSIYPTDIDLSRVSNDGPKLLRQYIEFASGSRSILSEKFDDIGVHFDSPFEESVYDFLIDKKYDVATQVGCSSYRIDLAVRHPEHNGRFAIGIECDGRMYHSARTARERDRLRQTVLEDMGWKIYRIWSTDWFKDPVTAGKKLTDAIEQAIKNYTEISMEKPQNQVKSQSYAEVKSKLILKQSEVPISTFKSSDLDDIPLKDIMQHMKVIIDQSFGIDKDELFAMTKQCYGRKRLTEKLTKIFNSAYQKLLLTGEIRERDNKIVKIV